MRFIVTVMDIFPERSARGNIMETPKQWRGLSLEQAWGKADRAVRRAISAYGGEFVKDNWGLSSGSAQAVFERPVRKCTITVDHSHKPRPRPRHMSQYQPKVMEYKTWEPTTNICHECECEGCATCGGVGRIFE